MRLAGALAVVLVFSASGAPKSLSLDAPSLYGQSAAAVLNRSFPSSRVEYLLIDVPEGHVEAERWSHLEKPVPAGSLLKPFVALAYAEMHDGDADRFPLITCHGSADGCWRSGGHGPMTLERALARSCNAYFLALAREVAGSGRGKDALDRVSTQLGLPAFPQDAGGKPAEPAALIGLRANWRMTPLTLARAYARLAAQPQTEVTARLLRGMRMAAEAGGTAVRIGMHDGGVLAKTGTAPCVAAPAEPCLADGDGLAIAAFPADHPTELLLVRERGTTGAETAAVAGRMLSLLETRHAAR